MPDRHWHITSYVTPRLNHGFTRHFKFHWFKGLYFLGLLEILDAVSGRSGRNGWQRVVGLNLLLLQLLEFEAHLSEVEVRFGRGAELGLRFGVEGRTEHNPVKLFLNLLFQH